MQSEELREAIAFARGLYPMSKDEQFAAFSARASAEDKQIVMDALVESHRNVRDAAFAPWEVIYSAIAAKKPRQPVRNPYTAGPRRMIDKLRQDAPTRFPATLPDADCIRDYYHECWRDGQRNERLGEYSRRLLAEIIEAHCRRALIDCGTAEVDADRIAAEVIHV